VADGPAGATEVVPEGPAVDADEEPEAPWQYEGPEARAPAVSRHWQNSAEQAAWFALGAVRHASLAAVHEPRVGVVAEGPAGATAVLDAEPEPAPVEVAVGKVRTWQYDGPEASAPALARHSQYKEAQCAWLASGAVEQVSWAASQEPAVGAVEDGPAGAAGVEEDSWKSERSC